jgi:hypothetical protein
VLRERKSARCATGDYFVTGFNQPGEFLYIEARIRPGARAVSCGELWHPATAKVRAEDLHLALLQHRYGCPPD